MGENAEARTVGAVETMPDRADHTGHAGSPAEERVPAPPWLKTLRRFALLSFVGAGVLTAILLGASVIASEAVAQRLSLAGDLAGGAAAAWAFVVAAVALRLNDATVEHLQSESHKEAQQLLRTDIESQFKLQRAERAFAVVLARLQLEHALDRIYYAVQAEPAVTIESESKITELPLQPSTRPLTCDAFERFLTAVARAQETGLLDLQVMCGARVIYTNSEGSTGPDQSYELIALTDMILNLAVFAGNDLATKREGLGWRWLTTTQLLKAGPQLPQAMLFSATATGDDGKSMVDLVRDELRCVSEARILRDWGSLTTAERDAGRETRLSG